MNIEFLVKKLIEKYGTNDPISLAKAMGITIFLADLGETLGFYNSFSRIKMININCNLSRALQKFVCAHEIAHSVLHPFLNVPYMRKSTFFSVDKTEREANSFAVFLLTFGMEINSDDTKECVLKRCGIPPEMVSFI